MSEEKCTIVNTSSDTFCPIPPLSLHRKTLGVVMYSYSDSTKTPWFWYYFLFAKIIPAVASDVMERMIIFVKV